MYRLRNIRYLIALLTAGVLCLSGLGAVIARAGSSAGERQDRADQGSVNNLEGYQIVKPIPRIVPFGPGEKLLFAIQYGLIYAGDATLEVRNIAVLDSVKSYHIFSMARTNRAFDVIFKVRDHHEAFMDYENLYSLRFEKHLREGHFRRDEVVVFDQERHLAIYKNKEVRIPPQTHDFLTALYFLRTIDLIPGQAVSMANHTGGKNYPIYVKIIGYEKVSVPAGEFDCVVVEPVLRTSSIFKHEGKLTIWMTDDNLKMPVLLRSKVIVGSFEARLKEYVLSDEEPRIPGISRKALDGKR